MNKNEKPVDDSRLGSSRVPINVGEQIELVGKSRKGKNRIARDGSIYLVKATASRLACLDGPGYLLSSQANGEMRWIMQENDPDFDIR